MKKSRFLALLLAVTLCATLLGGVLPVPVFAAVSGSGTENDPYIISSSADLSKLKNSSSYFKLGADIYLSAKNWTPIDFSGVLDGDGHTLKITRDTENSTAKVALFDTNKGTIRNLNVHCGIYHKFYSPSSSGKMAGICITNNGIIEGCNVTGSIEGVIFHTSYRNAYVGGICETNRGTIRDCGVYADVEADSHSSYCDNYAGGICVTNETGATITRCVVKNYMICDDGGGGIAKTNKGTITECCVASSLSITGGAIAEGGTVENCINFSTQYRGTAIGSGHKNCINAGGFWYSGTGISSGADNCYDIGNLKLMTSGYGLAMDKSYTAADFPGLDFEKIWYITDYGVPYLRNLNLPKVQSVNILCGDKLYVGGETNAELEILPQNAVLYSLSCSFTEGEHEATLYSGSADTSLKIKPVSVGATRLVISDACAGVLGFKNFNFVQGVETITVTGPTRMAVGQTIKLTAVAGPSNAENTNVIFKASELLGNRLTVRADGTVTANTLGEAWVFAVSEDGNVSVRYDIVVANIPTSVKLSETEAIIYPDEVRYLRATVLPEDAEDPSYRWESSDPSVATVDENGMVTPIRYGTAVIRAICNDGGAYGECVITVAPKPENFTLSGPDTIVVGETATYKLEALPTGTVIRETHWQIDNERVAQVKQIDLTTVEITGLLGGETQLQVFTGDRMMYLDIHVVRHPDYLEIADEEIFMTAGQQKQLIAEVGPEDTTDKTVIWTSEDETIASVSAEGKITAHKVGEVKITCKTADGQKSDQVTVRVQIPATSLKVEETDMVLYVDEVRKINAVIQPADATYKNVRLSASNDLLVLDQENASIRGVSAGTCVLQVSTQDGSLTETVFVTILAANHVYSDPVFAWNEDYTECTAHRTCVNSCPNVQTEKCTVTKAVQEASCSKEGQTVYTAKVSFDGKTYQDTRTVPIPKDEHSWTQATCTASKTCTSCGTTEGSPTNHSYGAGEVTTKPTQTQEGVMTYTCTVCGDTTTEPIQKTGFDGVFRLYGDNRYATATAAADMLKEVLGVEKFETIIVASGTDFADALSGSYLAAMKDAPILLIRNRDIEMNQVKTYIKNNLVPGGTVYLLGGTKAVPEAMEKGLEGFQVKRLWGATRYETNLAILKEAGVEGKDILVCTGKGFADSLSASAVGLPILLVKDNLNAEQKSLLNSVNGDFIIVGGTSAVNRTTENQLLTYGRAKRLAGGTRYETSVLVAKEFFSDPNGMVIAYGMNFPDGLAGGPLAYQLNMPLILATSDKAAGAKDYAKNYTVQDGIVMGGSKLVNDRAVASIFQIAPEAISKR